MDLRMARRIGLLILFFGAAAALQRSADVTEERARRTGDDPAKRDPVLVRQDAWFAKQVAQDCVKGPYDQYAIDLVLRAFHGDLTVFPGQRDPRGRRADIPINLKTRPNPNGEGVIVTSWRDGNPHGMADFFRKRRGWLVLDGKVYALSGDAANDLGFLSDRMPDEIQRRAGVTHTYERGRKRMMEQLGIDEATYERRTFATGNPFPDCSGSSPQR